MAAAAVLRIGRWIKGDGRGVKGGNGAKGREALSNSISIGRHGGWPAVPTRFRTHSKFVYAPRDRMSRAEIVPSRDSVCQRASSSTRHREPNEYVHWYWTRQSMSAIMDLSLVFHPVAWFMIQSETLPDRPIGLKLEHALCYRTRLIGFHQLNSGSGQGKRSLFREDRTGEWFFRSSCLG